ncbi:condensation domain-containing protein [Steroidobacter flavus]|uniref:Condensation domain-containing protein n=1 Tax=Steroidobacter flavus TaxID=1842136 RepID=A0ABV8SIK9_9GAMM
MKAATRRSIPAEVSEVLGMAHGKGVRLWSDSGQLRYRAPKGALSRDDIIKLSVHSRDIVNLLEESAGGADVLELLLQSRPDGERAPVTLSQLAHWRFHQLGEHPSIRQIASATRLRGSLSLEAMQTSVAETIRRHDALRTRVMVSDGAPVQVIERNGNYDLCVENISGVPEELRASEIGRHIEELILEPVDVASDPLFGIRLLRLSDDEHVLITVMAHIISDASSGAIFLRDLLMGYRQAASAQSLRLPVIGTQFSQYAAWQAKAYPSWLDKQGAQWIQHVSSAIPTQFPDDAPVVAEGRAGWGTVPLRIDAELKRELREWCRLRRTTVPMAVFTAYAIVVMRWCNTSDYVFPYQSDGRVRPEIENTIGLFAAVLYLRITLRPSDRLIEVLSQVTQEYCRAYEHSDFSYALANQEPRPRFTLNAAFNWVPASDAGDSAARTVHSGIVDSPVPFVHPMSRNRHPRLKNLPGKHDPAVLLQDCEDRIVGDIYFPLSRFSLDTMRSFGSDFLGTLRELISHPEARASGMSRS